MKYLKIKNNGLIEQQALHLVGASTKRYDDTKIGQFGSGNKYALAFLLRNKYDVRIFAGKRELRITTVTEKFRDQSFDVIHINGEKTSITTDMGKDWKLWESVREIYCNAIDEGGAGLDFVNEIEPTDGETHFYINVSRDVKEFIGNFDNYFSFEKETLFECEVGKIIEKSGSTANIYRKGIRCYETPKTSTFDYDFKDIEIGENRSVSYSWRIDERLWDLIFRCDNEAVIRKILLNCSGKTSLEGGMNDVSDISAKNISETFVRVIKSYNIVPREYAGLLNPDEIHNHVELPAKIFYALRDVLKDDNVVDSFKIGRDNSFYRIQEPTPLQAQTIKKANEFLNEVGFKNPYDIEVAVFDKKEILGCADNHTIILSDICLERGVNEVINTIIEEFIHLKYHVKDKTRAFQTAIITEFISYMKSQNAIIV